MLLWNDTAILTNEKIVEWTDAAEEIYIKALNGKEKPSQKLRFSLEETLIQFREHYGTDETCNIKCFKSKGLLSFTISQRGEQINPLEVEDNFLSSDLLEKLNLKPKYFYQAKHGINAVTIPIQLPAKKNALLLELALAVVIAVLTRFIVMALPAEVGELYVKPVISELFKKLSMVFAAVATPFVFCAVINGINGIGDVVSFGKVGARLLRRMMFTYCLAMVIMVAIGGFMGLATTQAGAAGGSVFKELLALVLDMVPNNLVEPFLNDNDLQVIVLSIFVGVIMLALGEKIERVRTIISELGDLMNKMMLTICRLMPLFVYLGISDLLLGDRLNNIYKVTQILIMSLCGAAILIGITCLRTKVVTGRSLKDIIVAQLPPLVINLTTSSQVSALPESIKCCKNKFGIDAKMLDFGLPLGIVFYMPNGAIMLGSTVWGLTVMSSGPVDVGTVIKIAFVAMVVAIAAPPIPGSALAVMPILFSACGTDLALMPLAVIVASTVGYLLPAMNGFCLQQELLMTAWKSDMVKKDTK